MTASIVADVRGIVTHQFALADFKQAFATMESRAASLKVVLRPGDFSATS